MKSLLLCIIFIMTASSIAHACNSYNCCCNGGMSIYDQYGIKIGTVRPDNHILIAPPTYLPPPPPRPLWEDPNYQYQQYLQQQYQR